MRNYKAMSTGAITPRTASLAKTLLVGSMIKSELNKDSSKIIDGEQDKEKLSKTSSEARVFEQNSENVLSFLSKNPELTEKLTRQINFQKKDSTVLEVEKEKVITPDDVAEELWKCKIEERTLLDVQISITKQIKVMKEKNLVNHDVMLSSLEKEMLEVDRNLRSLRKIIHDLDEQIDFTRVGQEMKKLLMQLNKHIRITMMQLVELQYMKSQAKY